MSIEHYLNSEDSVLAETALKTSAASVSPAQWKKTLTQGEITKSEETTALKLTPSLTLGLTIGSGVNNKGADYKRQWQEKLIDPLIGWRERRWQQRHQNPSQRALQESWSYYAGLYQTKGPNGKKLQQLIRRNGIPDWGNPYLEGMSEYYEIHPEGLLMGEVEFLLNHIEADLQGLPEEEPTTNNEDKAKIFLSGRVPARQTMEGALRQGVEMQRQQEQQWRAEGERCWAILLTMAVKQGQRLQRLQQIVHPDNLWFITWGAYQNFPESYLGITKEEVLLAAKELSMQFPELEENKSTGESTKEKQQ